MARGVTIKTTGLKELIKKFGKIPEEVRQQVDGVLGAGALMFEDRAVNDAPVDFGPLRGGITKNRVKEMHYEVTSNANYSAYVEFGTITKVSVPADLVNYAAQFKGKGLKTNGGMLARPFFFTQRAPVMAQIEKDLQPAIKKALNK